MRYGDFMLRAIRGVNCEIAVYGLGYSSAMQ